MSHTKGSLQQYDQGGQKVKAHLSSYQENGLQTVFPDLVPPYKHCDQPEKTPYSKVNLGG